MKKLFFENLPKRSNGQILWNKSIGMYIDFVYESVSGKLQIIDYNTNGKYNIVLKYGDVSKSLTSEDLLKARIGKLIGYKKEHIYLYNIGDKIINDDNNFTVVDLTKQKINRKDNKIEFKYGYNVKCNTCGYDNYFISERNLKLGQKCPCCSNKVVVHGINDIPTTDPWMIPYFQGGYDEAKNYTHTSSHQIKPICQNCGKVSKYLYKISELHKYHGFPCECSDSLSKISKYMRSLLNQLVNLNQIDSYDTEIKFDLCNFYNVYKEKASYGIFDFVIESMKLIIETDGGFHRTDNLMSGQTAEESKFIDDAKDKCAIDNGYKVIRVSDQNDFKQSVLNNLGKIFDLNDISWERCERESLTNYQIIAINLKNENPSYTTFDIANKLKFGETTIRRWLNYGRKAGICNYDAEFEKTRFQFHKGNLPLNLREVICLNNGMIFKSSAELSKKSEEIFGQKISVSSISTCCNRKVQNIRGFIFRFSSDLTSEDDALLNKNLNKIKLEEVNNKILIEFEKFVKNNPGLVPKLDALYQERKQCS